MPCLVYWAVRGPGALPGVLPDAFALTGVSGETWPPVP
jgi:hypothetical protein